MEKSIEDIWSKGFSEYTEMDIPQLNNLYSRKSEHLIDKYRNIFGKNINWIVIGASIMLIATSLLGFAYFGVAMFLMLNFMALVDKRLLSRLKEIDKFKNSYEYLQSFRAWMQYRGNVNIQIARVFYPFFFLSLVLGICFFKLDGQMLLFHLLDALRENFSNSYWLWGIPALMLGGIMGISALLLKFAERLYKWDIKLVYGEIMGKLDDLLEDIEELRS
ncbi:MAG: hypothetical protein AAFR87_20545 [Bacteroidota bacterium]